VHVRHASVRNIRSIERFLWDVDQQRNTNDLAGWHVILGENGSGKSSMLRAIALAIAGPSDAPALRQDWSSWLRRSSDEGEVNLLFEPHPGWDEYEGSPYPSEGFTPDVLVRFDRRDRHIDFKQEQSRSNPNRHVWSGEPGWFSASYGPFRRFSGGDEDAERLYRSYHRLARHLTTFGESFALSECTDWLHDLKFKALEAEKAGEPDGGEAGRLLLRLFGFINDSGLLPHDTRMADVTSDDVFFMDGDGHAVPIDDLGDGYRSILSLVFELLRNLVEEFGDGRVFDGTGVRIQVPGVVLIDEIDAHLHPHWQRLIGHWFIERFPRMQFIVTTHSPLVCQAAERGTIYRLPQPGSDDEGGFVTGSERDRLLYGNVLDAYDTQSFGVVPTRSKAGRLKLQRLADLNLKARRAPLDPAEEQEREHLRQILPTMARDESLP
jgi:hypothetical protein